MQPALTQADKDYIKIVKKNLKLIKRDCKKEVLVSGFGWIHQYSKATENIRQDMIDSFIDDLIHDKKTYFYGMSLIGKDLNYMRQILKPLTNNNLSQWLIVRMNHLIDDKGKTHFYLIDQFIQQKNIDIVLELFNKSLIYGENEFGALESSEIYTTINYFRDLLHQFENRSHDIFQIFVKHIQQSKMDKSELRLFSLYKEVFGKQYLNEFIQSFNLATIKPLCMIGQKNALSILEINLNSLVLSDLSVMNIKAISNILSQQDNNLFPKFYILNTPNQEVLNLAIETVHYQSELKVQTLLELLVSIKYNYYQDSINNHEQLMLLTTQVNEQINLECLISENDSVIKKGALKI